MYKVSFDASNKQWQAYQLLTDDVTNFVGYGGSARSGKSYLLAYWLVMSALAYPDTGWGLGRKELKNLKRTTLLTLFKVFDECGLEKGTHYNYNQQNQVITFHNGSDIFLIDTAYQPSDPLYTRYGGLELTGCAIDESNETKLEAIQILFSRIGWRNNDTYNLGRKMLETFNPDKGHVYSRYYKPFRDKNELEHVKFIPALPKDNPHPSTQEWIKDMVKNANKVTIERLVYGNFDYDDDPTALIDYESILNLWNNDHIEEGEKFITADIARFGQDKTVVMVWSGLIVKEIHTLDISSINDSVALINQLRQTHQIGVSNVCIDEDGVGGGVKDNIKGSKGFVNNSRPIKKQNYANLKTQCYYTLAEYINKAKIYIETETGKEDIIQELEYVKMYDMDKDNKLKILPKDKVKEHIGRSPDYSDSLAMRMYFVLKPKSKYSSV